MSTIEALEAEVGQDLDDEVTKSTRLSGGDVADAYRLDLASGRVVFAKTHRHPPPLFFDTEARGLETLRETGTVEVPRVLAVSDEPTPLLVLEWIDEAPRSLADEPDFGRRLAAMHLVEAPCFGRPDGRTTGSRRLPNPPRESWSSFYGGCRLEPLARLARDEGALPAATITDLTQLAARLDSFGLTEPPSTLHGDLWAGNRLTDSAGRSWLVDPASHGGHREFDLAMMRLFGGFSDQCFDAYLEASPLSDDWAERVELHQTAPLVVHAIKFGGGYVSAASAAIAKYR